MVTGVQTCALPIFIFVDTEESNWAYDVERGQFYWHRFFSHQPDLNYDNASVIEAVHDIIRF